MMLKEYEGKTLEIAYEQASTDLKCSIMDLDIVIVQYSSNGFLGLFKKNAIIKAQIKDKKHNKTTSSNKHNIHKKSDKRDIKVETLTTKLNALNKQDNIKPKEKQQEQVVSTKQVKKEKIFDDFYDSKKQELHKSPVVKKENQDLILEIKKEVNQLFSKLCYEIDEIQVDILNDTSSQEQDQKTVYIEFSGVDSALLIGKEGYRYKALSYILFNWINEKYNMMLRLEVAQFLTNQENAIYSYLEPVIETIKQEGFYKTKLLDGILVHIALTKLRDEFPDKYVAVKSTQRGEKYILVNEYRK